MSAGLLAILLLGAGPCGPPHAVSRSGQMAFDPQTGKWSDVTPPEPGTPEGDLAIVRRDLADHDYAATVKAARRWLGTYGAGHALSPTVRLCLAEGLFGQREYTKAHEVCAEVIAEGGTDPDSARAAQLEFVVAEVFLAGTRRKWLGLRILSGEELAISILDRLSQLNAPPRIAEYAIKTKADHYFNRGDFDLADDEYAKLLAGFPTSPYAPWVALRRAQAALARFPGTKFDDAALVEAEYRFLRYREQYPAEAAAENVDLVLEDIRNTRAQKEYEIAAWYDKVGQPGAADFYYRSVARNWPGTVAAVRAAAHMVSAAEAPSESAPDAAGDPQ